jgi:hypothetical protein
MGNHEDADESFKEALKICEGDPNWPSDSMKRIIEAIKKEREANLKLQLRKTT